MKWATPESPHGLWAFCVICGKDMRALRSRKSTCSDECHKERQREKDRLRYAKRMAEDPDFAKKQSARQYERIKSDPELWAKHVAAKKIRDKMPNYRESLRRGWKKYRQKNKQKYAEYHRQYRDNNPEVIARIEAKRTKRRSLMREKIKRENPDLYEKILAKERADDARRKAEKRLAELQLELNKMVDHDRDNRD